MNWAEIWIKFFGTAEFLGLDIGFWASMTIVAVIVVIMNVVFWGMKPKEKD